MCPDHAHVYPFCLTYICAIYLSGRCSWSGQVRTTKFTETVIHGGRGSHVHANPSRPALVCAQADRAGCILKWAMRESK